MKKTNIEKANKSNKKKVALLIALILILFIALLALVSCKKEEEVISGSEKENTFYDRDVEKRGLGINVDAAAKEEVIEKEEEENKEDAVEVKDNEDLTPSNTEEKSETVLETIRETPSEEQKVVTESPSPSPSSGGNSSSNNANNTETSNNKGSAVESNTNTVESNTNAPTTPTPTTPAAHEHNWIPVTESKYVVDKAAYDEKVLVKEAWNEEVSIPKEKKVGMYVCECGEGFETSAGLEAHQFKYIDTAEDDLHSSWHSGSKTITVYETTTVHHDAEYKTVHHDAVGHYENVTTGYKCSTCGAIK